VAADGLGLPLLHVCHENKEFYFLFFTTTEHIEKNGMRVCQRADLLGEQATTFEQGGQHVFVSIDFA
jgi:hypothetical protein